MAELVEVTATRSHRSGYAVKGRVEPGDTYSVPVSALPSLVRQQLVADPAAPKPKGKAKASGGDDAPAEGGAGAA